MTLLAAQATSSFPGAVTASTQSQAAVDGFSKLEVSFKTNTANPLVVVGPKQPNFDTEVLGPLRAAQAEAAVKAAEAAKAARLAEIARQKAATAKVAPLVIHSGDVWAALRMCEAGGSYTRNSGNGYYGAYQFDIRTWNNYGGYARADLAPPAVQDAKAQDTQARRGWSPWPACARKLGLL